METVSFPLETMADVRTLRKALEGGGFYVTAEDRDALIDRLKESVADVALTILINHDRAKIQRFLADAD